MKYLGRLSLLISVISSANLAFAQTMDFRAVRAEVDFSDHLCIWDGFGFCFWGRCSTFDKF